MHHETLKHFFFFAFMLHIKEDIAIYILLFLLLRVDSFFFCHLSFYKLNFYILKLKVFYLRIHGT